MKTKKASSTTTQGALRMKTRKTCRAAVALSVLPILSALLFAGSAAAHVPLFVCGAANDGTISCEGAFSDGASAEGLPVRVTDNQGAILFEGKLDKEQLVHFPKPQVAEFTVTFDAGEGHIVTLKHDEID